MDFKKYIDELDLYISSSLPERDKTLAYSKVEEMKYTLMGKIDYRYYEKLHFEEIDTIIKDWTFFQNIDKKINVGFDFIKNNRINIK